MSDLPFPEPGLDSLGPEEKDASPPDFPEVELTSEVDPESIPLAALADDPEELPGMIERKKTEIDNLRDRQLAYEVVTAAIERHFERAAQEIDELTNKAKRANWVGEVLSSHGEYQSHKDELSSIKRDIQTARHRRDRLESEQKFELAKLRD